VPELPLVPDVVAAVKIQKGRPQSGSS
jgi:hypothetical protein